MKKLAGNNLLSPALVALFMVWSGCSPNTDQYKFPKDKVEDVIIPNNVYMAGYSHDQVTPLYLHHAVIWNRGMGSRLPMYTTDFGFTFAGINSAYLAGVNVMYPSGTNIYLAGWEYRHVPGVFIPDYIPHAVYWNNGHKLPVDNDERGNSMANSVHASNGIVVVGGWKSASYHLGGVNVARKVATIWKNGEAELLNPAGYGGEVLSVFVFGNDIYAAGYEFDNEDPTKRKTKFATLWKNGEPQRLSFEVFDSKAYSVFVDGDDVYVAGVQVFDRWSKFGDDHAMFWKNGKPQILHDNNTLYGEARFVCMHKGDVYVAGYEAEYIPDITDGSFRPTIWKNGQAQHLEYAEGPKGPANAFHRQDAQLSSLFFCPQGEIYASGWQRNFFGSINIEDYDYRATVWRNGKGKTLEKNHKSYGMGVYVR
jgi:hypothetical protein